MMTFLKRMFRRNPLVNWIRTRPRIRRLFQRLNADVQPFVNDPILRDVVDHVLDAGATQVIETGTHLGFTIRYLAARHAALPMTTIESNPKFFAAARTVLNK